MTESIDDAVGEAIGEAIGEATAWMDIPGVEFVGQGEHEGLDCILVGISIPVDEMRETLPKQLHGFAVVIQSSGTFHAE